jgi:hypothetical protein
LEMSECNSYEHWPFTASLALHVTDIAALRQVFFQRLTMYWNSETMDPETLLNNLKLQRKISVNVGFYIFDRRSI